MKKLLLVLLVTGCGCLMAMGGAVAAADQMPASGTRITTVDTADTPQEVFFTSAQMAKIGLLRGMLEEPLVAKSENINLSKSCVDAPYLRYGVLQHIPTLVGFEKRVDLERYLDSVAPALTIAITHALRFLDASPTFKWVHAYLIKRLVSNQEFFKWSLVDIENLKMAMRFAWTDRLTESLNLLKILRLKNGLVTTHNFPGGEPTLSNDGSLLAIYSRLPASYAKMGSNVSLQNVTLYRTSDGNRVGQLKNSFGPQFTADGSLIAVQQANLTGARLYHTSDLTPTGPRRTAAGFFSVISPDGKVLAEGTNTVFYFYRTHDSADAVTTLDGDLIGFSPNSSLVAIIRRQRDESTTVSLYRTNDLIHAAFTIAGKDVIFSPYGQLLAIKIDDDKIAVYRTNNLTRAIAIINGQRCAFSSNELLVAIEQEHNYVTIYPVDNLLNRIVTIEGSNPFFSPNDTLLAVQHEGHIRLYSTNDWVQIGSPIHGHLPLYVNSPNFSRDGSLLCIERIERPVGEGYEKTVNDICIAHDGTLLAHDLRDVRFGSDDFDIAIAYIRSDDPARTVMFERTLTMTIDEYLLVLAAIHQRNNIDEAFWRPMFDAAQPQVQKFVREKTDKFILPFWQRYTGMLAAHLHWPFSKS